MWHYCQQLMMADRKQVEMISLYGTRSDGQISLRLASPQLSFYQTLCPDTSLGIELL